jgi:hypothetical protein
VESKRALNITGTHFFNLHAAGALTAGRVSQNFESVEVPLHLSGIHFRFIWGLD